MEVGISQPVGTRWFREGGGMAPSHLSFSSKPLSGRYLTFSEPEQIALWRAQRLGVREIARRLRRAASTTSRELRRNGAKRELTQCLRTGRALRVPRARLLRRRKSFVTPEIPISERPAEAEDRAVPGHWEGDLFLGHSSSAIGTLVERTMRFTMLLHLPPMEGCGTGLREKNGPALAGHGAEAVRDAIAGTITTLPEQLRRSLTWDQGAEMAQHARLRIDTGMQVYFCDPHSRTFPRRRGRWATTDGSAAPASRHGTKYAAARPRAPARGTVGSMSPWQSATAVMHPLQVLALPSGGPHMALPHPDSPTCKQFLPPGRERQRRQDNGVFSAG